MHYVTMILKRCPLTKLYNDIIPSQYLTRGDKVIFISFDIQNINTPTRLYRCSYTLQIKASVRTALNMANRVNQGFTQDGTESKSTSVSSPEFRSQENTQNKTSSSNDNLLKLAVIFVVILIIAVVVIGVFYAKEVRDNDEDHDKSPQNGDLTTPSTSSVFCMDDNCIRNAAGIRL